MENNGWIKLHRRIMETPEWFAEPFTRAQAWIDLLLLANHQIGYIRKRGILIDVQRGQVGYSEESLAARWKWSRKKVRRFLSELQDRKQITRKPAQIQQHRSFSENQDGKDEKRIQQNPRLSNLISIENYDLYQSGDTTEDTTEDTTKGQQKIQEQRRIRRIRNTPLDFSEISSLEERYSDRELISQCFKSISSTRKTNRISDSVKLNILSKWNKYPVDQVMAGIRIYLEKDYAAQGKDEKYLLGIIRGSAQQNTGANITGGKVIKSTGSHLLDRENQRKGFMII